MKNVFKKLFSLMLVAVMLVSVLPMTAMAASGVDVYVKDETGDIYHGPNPGVDFPLEEYLKAAMPDYADTYEVVKYYYKDANGTPKDPASASDKAANGSTVIVKLAHKPVTVVLNINLDGAEAQKSFTVPYGDTIKLDKSLLTRFFDVNVKTFNCKVQVTGEYDGQAIKADGYKVIDIEATSVKKEDTNPDNSVETDAKAIKWEVRIDGQETEANSFVPSSNDGTTTVGNILNYKYSKKDTWAKDYKMIRYSLNGKTVEPGNLSDVVKAGDTIAIRLEKIGTSTNPSNPSNPSTTAKKELTLQVKFDGTVNKKVYTFNEDEWTTISGNKVKDVFSNYSDDYIVDEVKIWDTVSEKNVKYIGLGADVKMDVHKTVLVTLSKKVSTGNSADKWEGTLYLHIYRDGKIDKEYKYYTSDDYSAVRSMMTDGVITKAEIIENFLPKYFSVVDSTKGFQVDGLYWDTDFQKNFVNDTEKFDRLDLDTMITKARGISHNQNIHISLMLTNAKVKTAAKSDGSNPKTGDSIFMTATVMTVSVTALAVLVLANKKRMVK